MSHYATRIDDLHWGKQFAASPLARESLPVMHQPQLLYPSSAPPAQERIVVHHYQQQAPVSGVVQNNPAPPVAVAPTSRQDMITMVLFVLVIALCLFVVHLNSKINSLQTLVNYMAIRSGNLPRL